MDSIGGEKKVQDEKEVERKEQAEKESMKNHFRTTSSTLPTPNPSNPAQTMPSTFLRPSFFSRLSRLPLTPRTILPPLLAFLSYLPIGIFLHDNIAQLMWITGPSMYPIFNSSWYVHGKLKRDIVFVDMRRGWEARTDGLKRGEVVAFW
ncbi:hypothetical protein MMC08_003664 [Hypocenomyce scalaris]|nr:hypothetical protein [Hypocenomyce scalaris]